eukprot:gene292-biopygen302
MVSTSDGWPLDVTSSLVCCDHSSDVISASVSTENSFSPVLVLWILRHLSPYPPVQRVCRLVGTQSSAATGPSCALNLRIGCTTLGALSQMATVPSSSEDAIAEKSGLYASLHTSELCTPRRRLTMCFRTRTSWCTMVPSRDAVVKTCWFHAMAHTRSVWPSICRRDLPRETSHSLTLPVADDATASTPPSWIHVTLEMGLDSSSRESSSLLTPVTASHVYTVSLRETARMFAHDDQSIKLRWKSSTMHGASSTRSATCGKVRAGSAFAPADAVFARTCCVTLRTPSPGPGCCRSCRWIFSTLPPAALRASSAKMDCASATEYGSTPARDREEEPPPAWFTVVLAVDVKLSRATSTLTHSRLGRVRLARPFGIDEGLWPVERSDGEKCAPERHISEAIWEYDVAVVVLSTDAAANPLQFWRLPPRVVFGAMALRLPPSRGEHDRLAVRAPAAAGKSCHSPRDPVR